jgi:8-oxo-dGTP pyrophosphatase MutT (NUDIX family)
MTKKEYVLGFLTDIHNNVALVRKKKGPGGQAGKLNGFGGEVHGGEDPAMAMAREFMEESGWVGSPKWWRMRPMTGSVDGEQWHVHCFWAVYTNFYEFTGCENVEVYPIDKVPGMCVKHVREWLVKVEEAKDICEQMKEHQA